jgi:hypothetical protein
VCVALLVQGHGIRLQAHELGGNLGSPTRPGAAWMGISGRDLVCSSGLNLPSSDTQSVGPM